MFKRFTNLLSIFTFIIISTNIAAEEIKIAIAAPTTGANAHNGALLIKGVELAITELNKTGKHTFKSTVFDDACETDKANDIANDIVGEGFAFVIGHLCSNATMVASSIYQEEGLILMSPASTAEGITTRAYDSIFRATYLDAQQGIFAAHYLKEHYLNKNISAEQILIFHNNDAYGKSIVSQLISNIGSDITANPLTPSNSQINKLIEHIKQNNIKVIYYAAFPDQMLKLAQAIEIANLDIQLIGSNALNDEWLFSEINSIKEHSQTRPILYTDEKKHDTKLSQYSLQAYAAMQSLAAAIKNSESQQSSDIIKAFHTLEIDSIMGDLSWSSNGDLEFNIQAFEIFQISQPSI